MPEQNPAIDAVITADHSGIHGIFASANQVRVKDLAVLCGQQTLAADYPLAASIIQNVVIYNAGALQETMAIQRKQVMTELHRVLSDGPGVLVIQKGFPRTDVLDRQTTVFEKLLEEEALQGAAGDHFAAVGANGRIWNSLQKVALHSPDAFIEYYANPFIGLVSEAWLGPYWQLTAQVNVVRPGGKAQQPHRDYHLGFQTDEVSARFPLPLHILSRYLTLQGAAAHTDMPLESGPTQLLPYSHRYDLGYLAWRNPDVIRFFQDKAVQIPLQKGDLLFFNPAVLHAAGSNQTENYQRVANLLQISSAFGKPMESIDRHAMMLAVYPRLLEYAADGRLTSEEIDAVVAATADGYSFPTNLDRDPPLNGLAPQTGQQLMRQAINSRWSLHTFQQHITELANKRQA